jgi:hypothetical protein
MRALPIVVVLIGTGDFTGFLERARPMQKPPLVLVRTVIAFHVGLLLGLVRRTDIGLNAQAQQKPAQGGGEVATTLAADRASDRGRR